MTSKLAILFLALSLPGYGQILAPILSSSAAPAVSFDIGVDFRATIGYVTDPAYATYEISVNSIDYPTTRSGITFGWEAIAGSGYPDARDRNAGVNAVLAGFGFTPNNSSTTTSTFRLNLPSTGTVSIRAGFGDASSGETQYVIFKDNNTVFATYTAVSTGGGQWMDATGVVRTSSADWTTNNAALSHTFTSTIFRIEIGSKVGGADFSTISNVRVTM